MSSQYTAVSKSLELSEYIIQLLQLDQSSSKDEEKFQKCSYSIRCPEQVDAYIKDLTRNQSMLSFKPLKNLFLCGSFSHSSHTSEKKNSSLSGLLGDSTHQEIFSDIDLVSRQSQKCRSELISGMTKISNYYLESLNLVDKSPSNNFSSQNSDKDISPRSSKNKQNRLKKLQKLITEQKIHNAELYNRYMCLLTMEYILASENIYNSSVEVYLKAINYAKSEINGADPLRNHGVFGLALTAKLNFGIENPPNFFIFDHQNTIDFNVSQGIEETQ